MILRDATAADAAALKSFDLGGQPSAWLDEVAEIVAGLVAWQHDDDLGDLDRRVIVAEVDGAIVAVTAHERLEHDTLGRHTRRTTGHTRGSRSGSDAAPMAF